jgi:hypothetical protein
MGRGRASFQSRRPTAKAIANMVNFSVVTKDGRKDSSLPISC